MICAMSIKKTGILLLSMTVLVTSVILSNQAYAVENGVVIPRPVGGLLEPVNESEVFGEIAKQYSLWLIPAISAIGIGTYLIKRKF